MRNLIRIVCIIYITFGTFLICYDLVYSYKKIETDERRIQQFIENKKTINLQKKTIKDSNFIGIIEIPKIELNRGFVNPYSIHNNISENITILKPFVMPNEKNSTFILAAHSGNSHISYFKNLYKLDIGDMVYIYFNNEKYEYKIVKYYTEKKDGNINIKDNNNNKKLILTTCKYFDKQLVYIAYLNRVM